MYDIWHELEEIWAFPKYINYLASLISIKFLKLYEIEFIL